MKKLFFLLVFVVGSFISNSQVVQFNDTLLVGGEIKTYAKNSNCIIVGNKGGLFKTTNYGQTWQNVSQNFNPFSVVCDQIISLGNDFYALSQGYYFQGIFKSSDNGSTWLQLSYPFLWTNTIGKLGTELYCVGVNGNGGKLYSSTNGINWTPKANIWDGPWYGGNLKLLSLSPNKLYLVYNDSLFFTTNGNTLNPISFNGLNTTYFDDDQFGGDNFDNLYYREDNIIYKYNFISNTWTEISTGKLPSGYGIIECSFTENSIYALVFNQLLMSVKLYKSTNQGASFSEMIVQNSAFPFFRNIIEATPNLLIANGIYDEVYYSINSGITWSKSNVGFIATSAENLQLCNNSLLLSRETIGILRSDNFGNNWNTSNIGLPGFGNIAYFVDNIFEVKNKLFCTNTNFNTGQISIYKSVNTGNSWSLLTLPSPYNNNDGVVFAGKCDSALFLNYFDPVSFSVGVIVSFDYGNTWIKPNNQNNYFLTFFKGSPNYLFAFNSFNDWDDFDNIYMVNNFGQSFTDISGNVISYDKAIKRSQLNRYSDKGNAIMDFDEQNINMPIFVIRDKINGKDVLYRFNTSSNSWTLINTNGLPANYIANAIKYIGNNRWLLATNVGLYISIDDGFTWQILHSPSSWQQGMEVNQILFNGTKAFLGTVSNGVWAVDVITGVLENLSSNEISIYPNPASDKFTLVVTENFKKNAIISLYSIEGKLLMSERIKDETTTFNVSNYPKGSYIVNISNGTSFLNKLLILK